MVEEILSEIFDNTDNSYEHQQKCIKDNLTDQILRSGRKWHKVNFYAEFNRFWIQSFPSPRLVGSPRLKNAVCPTIYL